MSQENIVIIIIALIIISLLLLTPIIGIITSITVFLITLIAGNYYWKDVGLGSAWVQTILIMILIVYTLLYLALSIVRESALLKIQACCYVLPALLFIIRLASEEVISMAIYIGVLTLMGFIFGIPLAGGGLAITFFVLILMGERPAFLFELFIVFFVLSIVYSICIIRIKKLSLIQLTCYSLPNVLIITWLWEWYFLVFYFLFLGLVVAMAILLQRFEIITKAHKSLKTFIRLIIEKTIFNIKKVKEKMSLNIEKIKEKIYKLKPKRKKKPKEIITKPPKEKGLTFKFRPMLKENGSTENKIKVKVKKVINFDKLKYILLLIIDLFIYIVASEFLQIWISVSEISKSITYYPEYTIFIILLIILLLSGTYLIIYLIYFIIFSILKRPKEIIL